MRAASETLVTRAHIKTQQGPVLAIIAATDMSRQTTIHHIHHVMRVIMVNIKKVATKRHVNNVLPAHSQAVLVPIHLVQDAVLGHTVLPVHHSAPHVQTAHTSQRKNNHTVSVVKMAQQQLQMKRPAYSHPTVGRHPETNAISTQAYP